MHLSLEGLACLAVFALVWLYVLDATLFGRGIWNSRPTRLARLAIKTPFRFVGTVVKGFFDLCAWAIAQRPSSIRYWLKAVMGGSALGILIWHLGMVLATYIVLPLTQACVRHLETSNYNFYFGLLLFSVYAVICVLAGLPKLLRTATNTWLMNELLLIAGVATYLAAIAGYMLMPNEQTQTLYLAVVIGILATAGVVFWHRTDNDRPGLNVAAHSYNSD